METLLALEVEPFYLYHVKRALLKARLRRETAEGF